MQNNGGTEKRKNAEADALAEKNEVSFSRVEKGTEIE